MRIVPVGRILPSGVGSEGQTHITRNSIEVAITNLETKDTIIFPTLRKAAL